MLLVVVVEDGLGAEVGEVLEAFTDSEHDDVVVGLIECLDLVLAVGIPLLHHFPGQAWWGDAGGPQAVRVPGMHLQLGDGLTVLPEDLAVDRLGHHHFVFLGQQPVSELLEAADQLVGKFVEPLGAREPGAEFRVFLKVFFQLGGRDLLRDLVVVGLLVVRVREHGFPGPQQLVVHEAERQDGDDSAQHPSRAGYPLLHRCRITPQVRWRAHVRRAGPPVRSSGGHRTCPCSRRHCR